MRFFVKAIASGFAMSLGSAIFKKVSKKIGLDEEKTEQEKADEAKAQAAEAEDEMEGEGETAAKGSAAVAAADDEDEDAGEKANDPSEPDAS